jgi:hypothetical protein
MKNNPMMKEALQRAGVELDLEPHDDLLTYLFRRCSSGKGSIRKYVAHATELGTPVVCTALWVVCKAYERGFDPEREAARALGVSVSSVRSMRRRWGIRKCTNPTTVAA